MKKRSRTILKRTGAAVLCAVFMVTAALPAAVYADGGSGESAAAAGAAEGLGGRVQGARTLAQIQISVGDGQKTPVFRAGEKVKLQISVKNNGNTDAQNVRISPVIKEESEWVFEMDQLNYEQELGTLEAGKQVDAVWGTDENMLTVKNSVSGKAYKLTFHITYDDGEKAYETEKYVFVKTAAQDKPAEEKPSGGGTSNSGSSSGAGSGGQNPGNTQGTGGKAPAYDGGTGGGSVYNSEPMISGGAAGEGAPSGGSSSGGSVPRVIVTGFTTEPGEVRAGNDFKLVVHLKNTSLRTAVSNMLFDFQAPSSGTEAAAEAPAFLPASGSSSVYLESIPAGGTKDIEINLNSRADLVQKPYSISMSMKYEDSAAAQYEVQSSLAIPVKQEARFEFSKIQIAPEEVAAGEEANISCSLYNLGRVKMYNVKARFEGKMLDAQEQFIGNLDAGATGTIDAIVTAKKATKGAEECRLVLTYEDDAGNVKTAEQKFSVTVMEDAGMDDMGMLPEDIPEEGQGIPWVILAAVVVAAAAAAGSVFLIKRRKRKIREAEEEELFDEVERFTEDEQ